MRSRLESILLPLLLAEGVAIGGGFSRISVFVIFLTALLELAIVVWQNRCVFWTPGISALSLLAVLVGGLFTVGIGIDRSESLLGVFRVITAGTIWLLIAQLEEKSKERCLELIPWMGIFFSSIGLICRLIPAFYERCFSAGRWTGPFLYPNVTALFLLVGIVITLEKETGGRRIILVLGMTGGIIQTGSRAVSVMAVVFAFYRILRNAKLRGKKPYILYSVFASALTGLVVAYILIPETWTGILPRLFSINFQESTLQGRILYWEDAIPMLMDNPMGLGYMGYFYLQQERQTGLYSVRYVHNEILQCALDYGIIPSVFVLVAFISCFRSERFPGWKKEAVMLIVLHALFDFDLQFFGMVFLLLLLTGDKGRKSITVSGRAVLMRTGIPVLTAVFFLASECLAALGYYEQACRLVPWSTQYRMGKLLQMENLEEAAKEAGVVLQYNRYLCAAYEIKGNYYATREDVNKYAEMKKRVLELRKYRVEEYEEYVSVLADLYVNSMMEGNEEKAEQCAGYLREVPQLLLEAKRSSSVRAYRIDEKPYLIMGDEYETICRLIGGHDEGE